MTCRTPTSKDNGISTISRANNIRSDSGPRRFSDTLMKSCGGPGPRIIRKQAGAKSDLRSEIRDLRFEISDLRFTRRGPGGTTPSELALLREAYHLSRHTVVGTGLLGRRREFAGKAFAGWLEKNAKWPCADVTGRFSYAAIAVGWARPTILAMDQDGGWDLRSSVVGTTPAAEVCSTTGRGGHRGPNRDELRLGARPTLRYL